MADDDIIKQAAIRRERNKSKNRIGGDLFVDGPRTPIPSPRQLNGKSVKALLNTCVMSSIINRHMFQHIFGSDENMKFMGDMATGVPITIEERTLQFDFHTRGDIPDVVLGLDFLTSFKCSLNLGDKTLALGSVSDSDYVCTKLISDRELPLRYRTGTNLAASV
ncbi:uncharacterized protein LOC110465856 isoform X2 [Mizuhopecten yessoensis]|uniref:Peptidase A2 domain-containing protein n=1 Tax=Mizuhopecten yessoensis TaxID=6573 RepID=A0A210R1U3_MIZYE|nr:uncharacterized protein LOC110465856 isoform X2 [Mizuhopecten yessoensis]OWF54952.1 hypothetical protein KP79_PYT17930 [Mizuhopecten yessoensis]